MNIHTMLEQFKVLNFNEMRVRCNHDMGSVWLTSDLDVLSPMRMHVRITDAYRVIRLYYTTHDNEQYRLTYQQETDRLRFATVTNNSLELDELVIQGALAFEGEEQLFQESLVRDMGNYTYGDLKVLAKMFYDLHTFAEKLLNEV